MTQLSRYRGLPVSEGVAAGQLYRGDTQAGDRPGTPDEVAAAFAAVAQERSALAQRLRDDGRGDEADIVTISALIAADPALVDPAVAAARQGAAAAAAFAAVAQERSALAQRLRDDGRGDEADIVAISALIAADPALVDPAVAAAREGAAAAAAVERSAAAQADALAALASPDLAARADDVRQVGNAVLAQLAGGFSAPPPPGNFILVERDVDPVDLIRLADSGLAGAVSVSGGASSHAAIIARGLGVPMLAGADPDVLTVPAGHQAILDGAGGQLIVDPSPQELAAVAGSAIPRWTDGAASSANGVPRPGAPGRPADVAGALRTADGQEIIVLCNVASATETRLGLAAGAAGVGLLRTEIPFTSATAWPTEAGHRAALDPVLELLAGRPVVVRLLDFSGDKIPPFLADGPTGLAALLSHPRALGDQLRAVLRSGRETRLSLMVPMVSTLDEMAQVRSALAGAAAEVGADEPELGMMVELAATASAAGEFARASDFFSIGTNDLTSQVLGLDRADPAMRPALAADPRVLALIAKVVQAAGAAGVDVSVCGDAAADPAVLPLLIGLGVHKLSVGAARLPQVAEWIANADISTCAALAAQALQAGNREQAQAHVKAP